MSNPNNGEYQNPWQSQPQQQAPQQAQQQPYPTQPVQQGQYAQSDQHGGAHPASAQFGQQQVAMAPYGQQPMQPQGAMMQHPMGNPALLGNARNSWACIGLSIITLGFYNFYWTYSVYNEMKRHRGSGTGGGVAVLLMFVPFATFFMTPSEVSNLYTSRGRVSPVSGATGLWCFLPFLGSLVWFLQVNGALNDYWTSLGAGRDHAALQQRPAGV